MWTRILSLLLLLSTLVESLLVVPSSPQCASLCGNTLSATSSAEITCYDSDYATSAYGATFKACLACELSSTYYDTTTKQTDLQWALYNLRYALSWCMFGFDNNTNVFSSPCLTSFSCAPLQQAIEYDSVDSNATAYSFCPLLTEYTASIQSCSTCLRLTGNENYIANFITVLDAACIQQPTLGNTLSLEGSVFSSQTVNITVPSATPISSYTPGENGLGLGGKIGIAVGILLVLLVMLGCCIVWRGKRRRRAVLASYQQSSGYHAWQQAQERIPHGSPYVNNSATSGIQGHFLDSPQSQRPLKRALSWDHGSSPESAQAEKTFFSPYSSNYSSPVSALSGPNLTGPWPVDNKGFVFANPEPAIEMVNVDTMDSRISVQQPAPPPVLRQPRLGRNSDDMQITKGRPF